MPPFRFRYLLITLAPLVVLVSGSVLLNLWVDPLQIVRDLRLTMGSYSLSRVLAELKYPAVSEESVDVVLLGTSRTRRGFVTVDVPEIINLGIDSASDRMIDNLLVGMLQNSARSRMYFVEASGSTYMRENGLPSDWLSQQFSPTLTKESLRQAAPRFWQFLTSAFPSAPPISVPNGAPERLVEDSARTRKILNYMRETIPVQPDTRGAIEQRIQLLHNLPVPHDALVVYYDTPYSSICLSDPLVLNAVQARVRIWREAVAAPIAASGGSSDTRSGDDKRQRVTVAYLSLSTAAEWTELERSQIWVNSNWFDASHYTPFIGQLVLDRLTQFAAEQTPSK